jgi:DNA repair exonuclease SbcCD ATPase subunit
MILHSIELENFGRFIEPARFEFAPGRVNLLSGPNGSGKSTVLAALSAAFVVPHRSTGDDIRRWQPWGRDLAPRVTVEFTSGGVRYRLTKTFTFSNRARAELEQLEGDEFRRVCEGDAVEQQIPQFLGGQLRSGVDARTREWLIAGVLWARQNGLAELRLEAPVQEAVRKSLGAQVRSGLPHTLVNEVQRLYDEDWTPTGRLAKASKVTVLSAEVAALEARVDDLRRGLDELDNLGRELERLAGQEASLAAKLGSRQEEAARLRQQYEQWKEVSARHRQGADQTAAKKAEYGRLELVLKARSSLAGRAQTAAEKKQQAEAALRAARENLERAEAASRAAREQLAAQMAGLEARIRNFNAPPQETLRRLESMAAERRELEARLEGALLHAEIVPETDLRLEVVQGEPQGPLEAKAGEPVRVSGSPVIELRVPGTGSFRLSGPAQSAEEIRAKLAEAHALWQRAAASFGTDSLEELKRRRSEADELELKLERLKEQARQHDEGRSETAQAVKEARAESLQWEKTLREAETELRALEEERQRLQTEPMDDARIPARLDELALQIHGLEQQLEQLARQLAAFPADLERQLQQLDQAAADLLNRLEQTRQQRRQAENQLAEKRGAASWTALAELEAELEEKRRQLEQARLRAGANRMLHDVLQEVIREAEAKVLPLVEKRAAKLFNEISGGFAQRVSLAGNSWLPAGVQPAGLEGAVAPDRVSGGEQEQLHLAVRLALADILTEREPFPVVLDDVLLATDEARLGRILGMLEERKRKMQFLILTCHPERFLALQDVQEIALHPAARAGA